MNHEGTNQSTLSGRRAQEVINEAVKPPDWSRPPMIRCLCGVQVAVQPGAIRRHVERCKPTWQGDEP